MQQLSGAATRLLNLESATSLGHTGLLTILDPSREGELLRLTDVRQLLAERVHLLPALRRRVVWAPGKIGRPWWVEDANFDVDAHLRSLTLAPPGSREQLGDLVAELHAERLGRSRPLWELGG